jgi:hypothetical protein
MTVNQASVLAQTCKLPHVCATRPKFRGARTLELATRNRNDRAHAASAAAQMGTGNSVEENILYRLAKGTG